MDLAMDYKAKYCANARHGEENIANLLVKRASSHKRLSWKKFQLYNYPMRDPASIHKAG